MNLCQMIVCINVWKVHAHQMMVWIKNPPKSNSWERGGWTDNLVKYLVHWKKNESVLPVMFVSLGTSTSNAGPVQRRWVNHGQLKHLRHEWTIYNKYSNIIYRNQPRLCAEAWRHGNELAVGACEQETEQLHSAAFDSTYRFISHTERFGFCSCLNYWDKLIKDGHWRLTSLWV
jgi:hypothetical protein